MRYGASQTLNCWLKGYQRQIRLTCGPAIVLLEGPWVEGQILYLNATPDSEQFKNYYTEYTKEKYWLQAIYTDTGSDFQFGIKLIMEGYGTFFYPTNAPNFWLFVEKFFKIKSWHNGKTFTFSRQSNLYTNIPKTTEIPDIYIPPDPPIWNPPPPGGGGGGVQPPIPPPDYLPPDEIDQTEFVRHLVRQYQPYAYPKYPFNESSIVNVQTEKISGITDSLLKQLIDEDKTYDAAIQFYHEWTIIPCYYQNAIIGVFAIPEYDIGWDMPDYIVAYAFNWKNISLATYVPGAGLWGPVNITASLLRIYK
jgi:hypothetical protein